MELRMEAFSQYEGDVSQLLNSNAGWAAVHSTASLIVGGGRDGGDALSIGGPSSDVAFTAGARMTLPDTETEAFVHFAYLTPQYPSTNTSQGLLQAYTADGSSGSVFRVMVNTSGGLDVRDSSDTLLGSSTPGVITPGAQHAIAVHFVVHNSNGVVEVWVDKEKRVELTSLDLGTTPVAMVTFNRNILSGGFPYQTRLMDVFINNTDGTRNNGFMGDPRLVFLRARRDDEDVQGWGVQRRYMFGTGVLSLQGNNNNACVTAADASAMRVGADDFTLEAHIRFLALPTGSNKATIFSKWLPNADNKRSWQLFYGGESLNSNRLELSVSTDGTSGTVTSPISISWSPVVGRRYHIAVQVEDGEVSLYIDGIRQSAPQPWPTPANNDSLFSIGAEQSGPTTFLANSGLIGYMDEVRFTKHVARYGAGFAVPTDKFPRNSTDDPDFSSVVLLAGFDSGILDESPSARVLTARGQAARLAPDDGPPGNYKVVIHGDRPDSYVEGAYLPAQALWTVTENPSNGDTVDADGVTYTFETAFSDTADSVLIGATIDDSIDNLVAAINGDTGEGTLYGTGTTPSTNATAANRGYETMSLLANVPGAAGNAVAVASSNAANVWSGSTLEGGADLPDPTAFIIERLPAHTTSVLAAALIHRSRKTDSGDAKVQPALVTAAGGSANGTEQALTTNFIFYSSLISVDPDTSAGLTPSTFINARIRLDRTE